MLVWLRMSESSLLRIIEISFAKRHVHRLGWKSILPKRWLRYKQDSRVAWNTSGCAVVASLRHLLQCIAMGEIKPSPPKDVNFLGTCFYPSSNQAYLFVSKNRGKTPQIIHFHRDLHDFHHPFWDIPIFAAKSFVAKKRKKRSFDARIRSRSRSLDFVLLLLPW